MTVVMKRVPTEASMQELQIAQYFSSEPWVSNPKNHCVPIYEVLSVPGDETCTIIVMPLLRLFNHPPFETVGEAIEAFRQLIEVIGSIIFAAFESANILCKPGCSIYAPTSCGALVGHS